MNYIKKFRELTKKDADIAGGKGASLGEMLNAGIPVPDGFVVTADTFDFFLAETDLVQEIGAILKKVDTQAIHTVDDASEQIQNLIRSAQMPESVASEILKDFDELDTAYVAVRSSATAEDGADHAWAGQLDSYLNTTKDMLLEKVQSCWASLFTPRAIFYRFEKGLHTTHISVAVVIQKMVNSEKSGIAFSVHPVTEDYNQMIIEAGLGLGEAIVSGSVTPDSYVVTKDPQEIIDSNVNTQTKALYRTATKGDHGFNEWRELSETEANQQVLDNTQIIELANIIERIENHYGFPCDIEWAYENNTFFIVQSRPITTLSNKTVDLKKNDSVAKLTFEREYTRDFSIILEDFWHHGLMSCYRDILQSEPLHETPLVTYIHDGVVETWQNRPFINDLKKKILERNIADPSFLNPIMADYRVLLDTFKQYRAQKKFAQSHKDIKELLAQFKEGIRLWIPWGHAAYVEETPKDIWDKTMALRDIDTFWDDADYVLRKSIINVYPELEGCENTILAEELLTGSDSFDNNQYTKRLSGYVHIPGRSHWFGDLASAEEKYRDLQFNYPTNEIVNNGFKGEIAYAGNQEVITGKVRIIKRKDQVRTLQDGEVLVSPMTTPDFEPAMKRAVITITDEGGITCHAAVVAREMKLPCITGTRIATSFLNDDDTVSVNTKTGVVTRIASKFPNGECFKNMSTPDAWNYTGKWIQNPLCSSFWAAYHQTDIVQKIYPDREFGIEFSVDGHWRENLVDITYMKSEIIRRYQDGSLDKFVQNFDSVGNEIQNVLLKEINEISINTLPLQEIFACYQDLFTYWGFLTFLGDLTMPVANEVNLVSSDGEFFEMTHPHLRLTWIEYEEEKTREIAQEVINLGAGVCNIELIKKNKTISKLVKEYFENFAWVGVNKWEGEGMNDEKLVERVNQAIENIKEGNFFESRSPNESIFKELNPLVQLGVSTAYWRATCASLAARFEYLIQERMSKLAKKHKITYNDIIYLSKHEVLILENEGTLLVPVKDIQERKEGFACFVDVEGTLNVVSGNNRVYQKLKKLYGSAPKLEFNKSFIEGMPACKGFAEGRVTIVSSKDDFHKFQKGNILVSEETTPAFVPLMRQASAIVTDRGGITSHAAIVSRELGKPCIIATKNATQILKDGDLVEVDADNGIVRIIETSQKKTQNEVEQDIVDKVAKQKYHYIHKRYRTPFYMELMWKGASVSCKDSKIPFDYLVEGLYLDTEIGFEDRDWNNAKKITWEFTHQNPKLFLKMIEDAYSIQTSIRKSIKKITQDIDKVNKQDVVRFWQEYARRMHAFGQYLLPPLFIESILEERIQKAITQVLSKHDFNEVFRILTTPMKLGTAVLEELSILDIAIAEKNKKPVDGLIEKHLEDFGWTKNNSHDGKFNTINDIEDSVQKVLSESDPSILKQHIEEDIAHTKEKFDSYFSMFDKETQSLIEILQESIYYRSWRTERYYKNAYYLDSLFRKTAEILNMQMYSDIFFLTIDEIISLLKGKSFDFKDLIQNRKLGYAVYATETGTHVFQGEDVLKMKESVKFFDESQQTDVIIGQQAYPGVVSGRARVILDKKNLDRVQEGDILITPATTVDYVPTLKKVKAIVTDEGGVLCHASVISRELRIPCIIGTKNGSKIIQDNSVVEVDANTGTVHILDKEQKENTHINFDLNQEPLVWGPVGMNSILSFTTWVPGLYNGFSKQFPGYSWPKLLALFKEYFFAWIHELQDIEKHGADVFVDLMMNPKVREQARSEWEQSKDRLRDVEEILEQHNLTQLSGDEYLNLWRQMETAITDFWVWSSLPELANYGSINVLKERLKNNVPKDNIMSVLEILTAPEDISFFQQEEIDLARTHDLEAHQQNYFWLNNSYAHIEVTPVSFFEKRKAVLSPSIETEIAERMASVKEAKQNVQKQYNLSDEIMEMAYRITDGIIWQDKRKKEVWVYLHYEEQMFHEAARRTNTDVQDVKLLLFEEFEPFIKGEINIDDIKNRTDGFLVYIDEHQNMKTYGSNIANYYWNHYFPSEKDLSITSLKGTVASKAESGNVQGSVRIILDATKCKDFCPGDVLVTTMTTPEFVFLMKQASAIVTDTGGLTSHAAIVARELGKPCIINTKSATRALEDGDLIEVNTDVGEVTIIERSNTSHSLPINPHDYKFIGLWKEDLFPAYFWARWFDVKKNNKLGFTEITNSGALILKGGNFFWSHQMRDQMKALLDRVVETKDTSLFKNLYKQANKCFRDTMKKADTLAKEEPDTENFETFIQLGRDLMYYWTFGASMAEFVDEYIIEHASREHIKPSDVVGYVDIPETELMRQQSALREFHQEFKKRGWLDRIDGDRESLIHDIQQDKKLYKKLEKHMYEYGWIEMLNYVGDVITFDRFLTIIGGVGEEQKPQEKKKVSDTFNFILNIASYIGYARQAGAEYSSVFSYKLHDYLKATAEKINVSYSEMLNLTPEEIILALSNNLDPQPLLQRRANRNWLVWWDKHQHAQVVDDSDIINKLYEKMVPIIEDDQRQLVGQTGNKGKVVGKVSVIMATEDFGAFKEGNILVTTMTTPDFVVLMQKASAIVTDIGGLLSHASIVSRELGKPCVIGTKFATQILKDGDMVEVDADNGVVKILEK